MREALTKEAEHRIIKTGKKISSATLKADKFYERATIDARDENWVHIAEHRDFWRECVVKPAKFHYNYRDPDEQVECKIRPATPEKPSAERQRANDWDEWLLTDQPLDEEAKLSKDPLNRWGGSLWDTRSCTSSRALAPKPFRL